MNVKFWVIVGENWVRVVMLIYPEKLIGLIDDKDEEVFDDVVGAIFAPTVPIFAGTKFCDMLDELNPKLVFRY